MLWFKCSEIIPGVSIGVGFIAVCIGAILFCLDLETPPDSERLCRMAESAAPDLDKYRDKNMKAFIVGYTGEVGKALVQHLAKTKPFQKVYLFGRREVTLNVDDPSYFEQKIVDFDRLEDSADVFKDIEVGFCSLGTTRAKAGVQGFIKVDYDYVVKTAELAKSGGCQHFSLVSSQGANKNSYFLYTKTKGQAEDAVKAMNFARYSIFRPGVLMCDREEWRAGESLARLILKPVAAVFPTAVSTPVDVLVKAMLNNVVSSSQNAYEMYENKAVHQLAGNLKKGCSGKNKVESTPKN